MRKVVLLAALAIAVAAATGVTLTRGPAPEAVTASSHREAPLISEDPTADNTDLYAFRSVDAPDHLTIISNWIPGEDPAAGPMYYTFSPNARYNVYIDRDGDARPDITYRFRFRASAPVAFLRSTVQPYTVTKTQNGRTTVVARGVTPPNNIGPRTTPDYRQKANEATTSLVGGGRVFAGQREDPFFGDIGAIFDSVAFRRGTGNAGGGKDFFAGYNLHSVALQIPISQLDDDNHVVGIWSTTDRRAVVVRNRRARAEWVQVSRIANPLVNELVIPTQLKDRWNRLTPREDGQFLRFVTQPILAGLINDLYPGAIDAPESNRNDLVQVFLTGVPNLNANGARGSDQLRINLSTPPTPLAQENRLGVVGGDLAGYPNGRRLRDDVIDIAEQAVGGVLLGNEKAKALGDGVDRNDRDGLGFFPYVDDPFEGFTNTKGEQKP